MLNFYNRTNQTQTTEAMAAKKANGIKKPDFKQYTDPTGELTSKKLRWGLWWIQHRTFLYKCAVGSLIFVNALLWLFSLWHWGVYTLGWQAHRALQRNLSTFTNYTGMHPRYTAQPLQVVANYVLVSRENAYDAVAEVMNPNERFLVTFDYYFVIGDQRTDRQQTFLLPGELRPVASLGLKNAFGAPQLVIENVRWQRISAHQVKNTKSWQMERLNFSVSDFSIRSLAAEGLNVNTVTFKLTNNSPYSYIQPRFYVALLQGQSIAALMPLELPILQSLETKTIDIGSLSATISVSDIAVYPLINIYDPTVYAAL